MHAEALIDQAPDRSVVPGYANIGAPWVTYALTSAAVGVTAAAGARAVDPAYGWRTTLIQPSCLFRKISYPCGACSSGR